MDVLYTLRIRAHFIKSFEARCCDNKRDELWFYTSMFYINYFITLMSDLRERKIAKEGFLPEMRALIGIVKEWNKSTYAYFNNLYCSSKDELHLTRLIKEFLEELVAIEMDNEE